MQVVASTPAFTAIAWHGGFFPKARLHNEHCSLVRSIARHAAGFFSEARRLIVAQTRAQRGLGIVGDDAFVSHATSFFHCLLTYIVENNMLVSLSSATKIKAVQGSTS